MKQYYSIVKKDEQGNRNGFFVIAGSMDDARAMAPLKPGETIESVKLLGGLNYEHKLLIGEQDPEEEEIKQQKMAGMEFGGDQETLP